MSPQSILSKAHFHFTICKILLLFLFIFLASPFSFSKDTEVKEIAEKLTAKEGGHAIPSKRVSYGSDSRQWMNLFLSENKSSPNPVYVFAHANAATADGFPLKTWGDLSKAGISAISWESIPNVKNLEQVNTCEADFKLVIDWVLTHAKEYNFDTNNIFVGGTSRGSVITWSYSHEDWKQIRGIYSMNALPDSAWGGQRNLLDAITTNSPPIFMAFRSYPNIDDDADAHDAIHGLVIADRYKELGIGDRATVVHSIGYTNQVFGTEWSGLVKFIQTISATSSSNVAH
jgi:hypothetical protein